MPSKKRAAFLAWLKQLEYEIHALPQEDLVIYLHLPVAAAHRLVAKKSARAYTKKKRDIQESNLAHLKAAAQVYDDLARQQNWMKIECAASAPGNAGGTKRPRNAAATSLRAPEEIHKEILAAVEARVFGPALPANK